MSKADQRVLLRASKIIDKIQKDLAAMSDIYAEINEEVWKAVVRLKYAG